MLSCKHIAEKASDYLEGRMSLWQRMRFKTHLRMCAACGNFTTNLGLSIKFTRLCGQSYASNEEVDEVLKKIRESEQS